MKAADFIKKLWGFLSIHFHVLQMKQNYKLLLLNKFTRKTRSAFKERFFFFQMAFSWEIKLPEADLKS